MRKAEEHVIEFEFDYHPFMEILGIISFCEAVIGLYHSFKVEEAVGKTRFLDTSAPITQKCECAS